MATKQEKINAACKAYKEDIAPFEKEYQKAIAIPYEKLLKATLPALNKRDKIIAEAKDD